MQQSKHGRFRSLITHYLPRCSTSNILEPSARPIKYSRREGRERLQTTTETGRGTRDLQPEVVRPELGPSFLKHPVLYTILPLRQKKYIIDPCPR